MSSVVFRKSKRSETMACVEVAFDGDHVVLRDSKDKGEGPELRFNKDEWKAFLEGLKAGEFDRK